MSEKIKVEKRSLFGKKLKQLRKQEILPANVYGKDFESTAVQLPLKDFIKLYKKIGETGIVNIGIDGKDTPALIHNVHINPVTQDPLHADFMKVNLKEKITAHIPIVFTGEAPAVKEGKGMLTNPIDEIEVEALPTDFPEKIELNIESLKEVGDHLTAKDISLPKEVEIKVDESTVIATIAELPEEEPEPTPEAETEEEKAEGEKETEQPTEETEDEAKE